MVFPEDTTLYNVAILLENLGKNTNFWNAHAEIVRDRYYKVGIMWIRLRVIDSVVSDEAANSDHSVLSQLNLLYGTSPARNS